MGEVDTTVEAFVSLNLDSISDDWVTEVWACGFVDAPLMPDDLKDGLSDNMNLSNKLAKLHDLLLPWALDQQHPSAQSFWTVLADNGVSTKHLVVLLYQLIKNGQEKSGSICNRLSASVAAGLYFLMLRIPGCRAFSVFSAEVFERALGVFKVINCSAAGVLVAVVEGFTAQFFPVA